MSCLDSPLSEPHSSFPSMAIDRRPIQTPPFNPMLPEFCLLGIQNFTNLLSLTQKALDSVDTNLALQVAIPVSHSESRTLCLVGCRLQGSAAVPCQLHQSLVALNIYHSPVPRA